MPRMSAIEGRRVYAAAGRSLGTVTAVLFDPAAPKVVGVQVRPHPLWYVIARKPRFVLIGDAELVGDEALRLAHARLPATTHGERALGHSWEDTVVWRGMPVVSAEGVPVGAVHDVVYARETHEVRKVMVTTGVLGDAAVGRLEVSGSFVRGFDGEHVVVEPGYDQLQGSGGIAKQAARGTAYAKVQGERLAASALSAGATAAAAVGRSFRTGAGRKAMDKLKSLMGEEE